MDSAFKDAVSEAILERLANGESLSTICVTEGMPNRSTVQRWQIDDAEFDAAVTRAREAGMHVRAEKAVEDAKKATDASLGRLAFDAERWYLGKLSNAFSDKVRHVGGDEGDAPIKMQVQEVRRVIVDPSNPDAP
ncbi:hypothetical protein K7W03_22380 [Sphingobium sp. PNB]|uniref:terminase small subunit-like protein n=1 Tax=Sphingobium sp. PNB TaxID=863934 RepID=UPI001CA431FC|nr:hypothetical protein [Sphingobium sp. PNB]MCB4862342.1 hypothetical protein [Sphingobium sp. PNB]